MGLPCPHPFPWDAAELTHHSLSPGNLTATHPYSELCPAAVMEIPTQGFGWRLKVGEKNLKQPRELSGVLKSHLISH